MRIRLRKLPAFRRESCHFSVLPLSEYLFQDYVFPGIALLLVNCVPNLVAFYLLLKKKKKGVALGGTLGVILMLWITIQFIIFPSNFLSQSYFAIGIIQALTGFMAYVFLSQESMVIKIEDYSGIGKKGAVARKPSNKGCAQPYFY